MLNCLVVLLPEGRAKRPKGVRVKLVPPTTLDECGIHNRRFRPKVAGTLWQMLLFWMSGECGLYLFIQISVMALASDVFFHAMNWTMGADDKPRMLQEDEEFIALPDGRRSLELPDQTLGFLREMTVARHSWRDTFRDEVELAKRLPEHLENDILEAIPAAYDAAITKYKKHLASYQLLPNSLSRMSEPTGPAYLRAFIVVFFPELAALEGFGAVEASDADVVQSGAEEIIDILSVAVVEADGDRQQFCHERLFKISILNSAQKVEAEYIEAATSKLVAEHQANKAAARLAGGPVPRSRQRLGKEVHTAATKLRVDALKAKRCNTLQLREGCSMVDGKPNAMLSQLLRIAKSNTSVLESPEPICWGVKCCCAGSCHHLPNCWKNVELVYWFLHRKFAHQYVHQAWIEGAFNIWRGGNRVIQKISVTKAIPTFF